MILYLTRNLIFSKYLKFFTFKKNMSLIKSPQNVKPNELYRISRD